MFYKIILSVKYLHDNSLVHRDIKPENIMITNTLRPKLADFGSTNIKKEMSKTFCGTYEYMAPEIYRRGQQNEKVDIWALGVLLYEITQCKTPFKGLTLNEIEQMVLGRKLRFKHGTNPLIKQFIYDVLKLDPKERPTCDQLLKNCIFDILKSSKRSAKKQDDSKSQRNIKKNLDV